jgi:predicted ATPase/class 3 adenylate cyclase
VTCPACGTDNEPGRKFCSECGAKLALACPTCGTANTPGAKFCGECGSRLGDQPAPVPTPARQAPEAERRLVTVLFADLVGFTALSETRDPEEVRELLSRYFDTARRVIGRYGGVVEKFIGDAVMAVWGTPVAREDDAERAVRTALELVGEVSALGAEAQAPDLRLRVGVISGEAAVTLGAEGQGMVAGDLVNTASRIQTAAQPGTVLVGQPTRRLSEAAIAYEDAGEHELKGKAEPVSLFRAVRVVGGRGGEGRSAGLEAPFVGREAELRTIKELFHATADERKSRLVSAVGVAGIGKSRLAWEFYKYIEGLVEEVWWHRGRCLPYGEGVAYWALAEMVRSRAGIVEDEAAPSAQEKLRASVELHVADLEERVWIEPRLAHLLGLAERAAQDQQDLFSAWRRFFELLAEQGPCVLLFEDLQWADAALLDFVEYLLEWSRDYPIFIVTLGRPELLERRPTWGAGRRNFHSIVLEPLPETARDELLEGLVPGLPEEVRARIVERAEGIPLYAVETVRMLLDRGLITRENGLYRVAGPVESLEVPETLHALIAARLDGLQPPERRLLEDAAVLGKTFTLRALASVSGLGEPELEPLLGGLVRKEILHVEADPRSPERGQYGFLHALFQKVAYDTLSRRERRSRHLAVAAFLEESWDEEEAAEVIASHYLEAYRSAPGADDADEIRAKARERLALAGERAASLAANAEAQRYFEQAAELGGDPLVTAGLLERAGEAARAGGHYEAAQAHLDQAVELFRQQGQSHPAARVSARLGFLMHSLGEIERAIPPMEEAFRVLGADEPGEDFAALAAELGRLHHFAGDNVRALERVELALETAEALNLPEVLSQALNTKSLILARRPHEAVGLMELALRIALDHDQTLAALRAYNNLAYFAEQQDRFADGRRILEDGLTLARRRGDRGWEMALLRNLAEILYLEGDWDGALATAAELPPVKTFISEEYPADVLIRLHTDRGELDDARSLRPIVESYELSADLQDRGRGALARSALARAEGRAREAFAEAREAIDALMAAGLVATAVEALAEASFVAENPDDLAPLLDSFARLPPSQRSGRMEGQLARTGARLAGTAGDPGRAEAGYKAGIARFRELGMPFWLAVTLAEYGEWLSDAGRPEEARPHLGEAHELLDRLKARPWLERLDRITGSAAVATA